MSVLQPVISVEGAAERNLANITCSIPIGSVTLLSGPSGAGKTTLALRVLAAESEFRKFFLHPPNGDPPPHRPNVKQIRNLPLVWTPERTWRRSDTRTLGEVFKLRTHLERYANKLERRCHSCGGPLDEPTIETTADELIRTKEACSIIAHFETSGELLSWALPRGFSRAWRAGQFLALDEIKDDMPGPWGVVVDTLIPSPEVRALLIDSIHLAGTASGSAALIVQGDRTRHWHRFGWCSECRTSGSFDTRGLLARIGDNLARYPVELSTLRLQAVSLHELFTERFTVLRDRLSTAKDITPTLFACISTLVEARLGHLSFDRMLNELSTGEFNRLRLLTLLTPGVRYPFLILDEPLSGLHPRDQSAILNVIGSHAETCLLIDHHPEARAVASWEIALGPQGGITGGQVTYEGRVRERVQRSLPPSRASRDCDSISFTEVPSVPGKHISGSIPLRAITAITGVSGAGKTRFLFDGLLPLLTAARAPKQKAGAEIPAQGRIVLPTKAPRVVSLPIRAQSVHPYSTVATLCGAYDQIRTWFAGLPLAKVRGYSAKDLALGKREARLVCGGCRGMGTIGDETECPHCHGTRFAPEFLEVQWRGYSLTQVLNQSISELIIYGGAIPKLAATLTSLESLGVSYLTLGQPTTTLSSGEFQRVVMAKELVLHESPTIFLLDEPSLGLAESETERLLMRLQDLTNAGHTVVMIEHDPLLVRSADWQIELGPDAGPNGGTVTHIGAPLHSPDVQ